MNEQRLCRDWTIKNRIAAVTAPYGKSWSPCVTRGRHNVVFSRRAPAVWRHASDATDARGMARAALPSDARESCHVPEILPQLL